MVLALEWILFSFSSLFLVISKNGFTESDILLEQRHIEQGHIEQGHIEQACVTNECVPLLCIVFCSCNT